VPVGTIDVNDEESGSSIGEADSELFLREEKMCVLPVRDEPVRDEPVRDELGCEDDPAADALPADILEDARLPAGAVRSLSCLVIGIPYLSASDGLTETESLIGLDCIGKGLSEVGAGGRLLSSTIRNASSRLFILSRSLGITLPDLSAN